MSDSEGDSWNDFLYISLIKDKTICGFPRSVCTAHANYSLFSIALIIRWYTIDYFHLFIFHLWQAVVDG